MSTAKEQITAFTPVPQIQETLSQIQALMETMTQSIKFLRQRNGELEAEVSLVEQERDEAFYLLAKLYLAWLTPNNDQEEIDWHEKVNSFLFNRGLLPGEPDHIAALAELCNQVEEREQGEAACPVQ